MVYVALQQRVALALKDSEASFEKVLALDSAKSVELSRRARYATCFRQVFIRVQNCCEILQAMERSMSMPTQWLMASET